MKLSFIYFIMPLVVATITPFIITYKTGDWAELTEQFVKSYESLDKFPTWYIVGVVLSRDRYSRFQIIFKEKHLQLVR